MYTYFINYFDVIVLITFHSGYSIGINLLCSDQNADYMKEWFIFY